jgi:hypothetical protein
MASRKTELPHSASVQLPCGRDLQYFADGTTLTRFPETEAFSASHCWSEGKPGDPGMLRHLAIGFDALANRERLSSENAEYGLKLDGNQDCRGDILSTAQ